jgi:ABC-type phosphate/phosphonate transport system substrate-binding protein
MFLLMMSVSLLSAGEMPSGNNTNPLFHFGFSSSMITDVNENDVKAAMKVWAQVLSRERGIPVDTEPSVLNGVEAIAHAVRSKLVDAVALTTDEYWILNKEIQSSIFIAGIQDGSITEEYVLLVHRDSGIENLRDLRGRRLGFFLSSRMSLALTWLDTHLAKNGFGRTAEFCRVKQDSKLSQVVLPVFFRQSDACLVTRLGFQTMSELNPQLGRQLKVLASSPELVPAGFCFRGNYTDPIKDRILGEIERVDMTPAGQQILTIFKSGKLKVYPISCLDSAFELLATHSRLFAAPSSAKGKTDAPGFGQGKSGMRGQ